MRPALRDNHEPLEGGVLFTAWAWIVAAVCMAHLWLRLRFTRDARGAHRSVRDACQRLFSLTRCPLRVTGVEHLSAVHGPVIVANHSSYLDSLVLHAALPGEYRFVVNHVAASRVVLGIMIRKLGYLVVDRRSPESRSRCAREIVSTLSAGIPVVVFPEGTRSAGELLPFQDGAFRAAVAAGRPVLPVAIVGTRDIWKPGGKRFRRGPVDVRVLSPLGMDASAGASALRETARHAIAESLAADQPPT